MNKHSTLLSKSLTIIYPFIIIFGLYVTLFGHLSPGGGFQGGAILTSVYISKYLVKPVYEDQIDKFKLIEKLMLIIILLLPILFLMLGTYQYFPLLRVPYLIIMNALIAAKVTCGISIIFFRFVFFESRSK